MAFANNNLLSGNGPQIPTIMAMQGGAPVVALTLMDLSNPTATLNCISALANQDQTAYATWAQTGGSVRAVAREVWDSQETLFDVACTEVDAETGSFRLSIPQTATTAPGIYVFEVALLNRDDILVSANAGYLEIRPSLRSEQTRSVMAMIPALRRMIRDTHPLDNRIIEECEFTTAEIMDAIGHTADDFNTMQPYMPQVAFSPVTFPWPDKLLEGAIAKLLRMAAVWYARNTLSINGEVADDMSGKAQMYIALADKYQKEFELWAKMMKRSINIANGWFRVPSRSFMGSARYRYRE